jgi:small subunit ribosomal protein S1
MSDQDEDFASMLAQFESGKPRAEKKRPRIGDVVQGAVISIGKDAVFVDVGGKAEGVLERSQVTDADDKLLVQVGDKIEARVVADAGGVLTLRVKLGGRGPEARAELQQAQELGIPVEGVVQEVVKGGSRWTWPACAASARRRRSTRASSRISPRTSASG